MEKVIAVITCFLTSSDEKEEKVDKVVVGEDSGFVRIVAFLFFFLLGLAGTSSWMFEHVDLELSILNRSHRDTLCYFIITLKYNIKKGKSYPKRPLTTFVSSRTLLVTSASCELKAVTSNLNSSTSWASIVAPALIYRRGSGEGKRSTLWRFRFDSRIQTF